MGKERVADTYPGIHMNATHGTLGSQLLCHSRDMADHVCTEGLVINSGSVQRVFPEEVIDEGQMSQHNNNATFQGETTIRISRLGKLKVQVGQGIEMRAEFRDESSRPL